jgi:tetratricopeptide (TPR) repeat protein
MSRFKEGLKLRETNLDIALKICQILFILLLYSSQNSYAIQSAYTIQTGSFDDVAAAQKQFDSLVQGFNEKELDNLRIEKIGAFYSVRLGKFKDYTTAENFIKAMKPRLSTAIILKAYIKDKRIIKLYSDSLSIDENELKEKSLSGTLPEKIKPQALLNADEKIKKKISAEAHERKGDVYVKNSRSFLAIEEYRQAIEQGINKPDLFWKLALVLYRMGLLDDAIVEMEKAVDLSSGDDLFRIDLGVLYLAKDRLEKAKEQFLVVLGINPGYALVYYYLGEVFLRTGNYDMAWLSVKMANRLGNKGQDIIRKLSALSKEPDVNPWKDAGEDLYIRQILVDTYEKAQDIVERLSGGELFENIAFKESIGSSAASGGFIGHFEPSAIHPKITEALLSREILADPVIVETEKGFHIVQRIVPFDLTSWKKLLADSGRSNY